MTQYVVPAEVRALLGYNKQNIVASQVSASRTMYLLTSHILRW